MIYMVITQQSGRLFIANLGHSFKSNTTRSVEVQPPHVGRLVELCIFCTSPCKGRNPHSLAQLTVVHTAFMLSPQATPVANDYCLLRGLSVCCPTAPPISLCTLYCTFLWVIAHCSVLTLSNGFRRLATCIRWADSNGTEGGQHRRVSLHQIIRVTNQKTAVLKVTNVIASEITLRHANFCVNAMATVRVGTLL
jgi:hypothetical protein